MIMPSLTVISRSNFISTSRRQGCQRDKQRFQHQRVRPDYEMLILMYYHEILLLSQQPGAICRATFWKTYSIAPWALCLENSLDCWIPHHQSDSWQPHEVCLIVGEVGDGTVSCLWMRIILNEVIITLIRPTLLSMRYVLRMPAIVSSRRCMAGAISFANS